MSTELILNGLQKSLILAIIAYGIMIPFRFLDFSDMTAEGAYPLGGAICAVCVSSGIPIFPAILLSIIFTGIMGACTAIIYLKLKMNSMLAGIILSAMAYSINLRIMGKPNIALFEFAGLFNENISQNILIMLGILAICIIPFAIFLATDFGLRFRAVGLNPSFAKAQKISIKKYTILGLTIAGIMYGLAGSLIVQIQNYMDISIGVGILIHGLASLMIGEVILGTNSLGRQLLAPILGAVIYQQIQGLALSFGLAPSDLKFFTGAIVLIVIAVKKNRIK